MTNPALFLSQSLFLFFTYPLINTYTCSFAYSYYYPFPTLYLVGREDQKWIKEHHTRSILAKNFGSFISLPKVEAYE